MDALSDVLRVVGLTGGLFLDAEFTEPWVVEGKVAAELCAPFGAPPRELVCFHYVAEGRFELRIGEAAPLEIRAGQAVMLPHNDTHVFGSRVDLQPRGVETLMRPPASLGLFEVRHGGGGARTRLVCGFLGGNEQLRPVLAALPPVMKIDFTGLPGGAWIERTLSYAAQTLSAAEPGAATVLAKVAELLFVESVRRYLAGLPPDQTGWFAALRDPVVGRALSLLHARVDHDWTTEDLARRLNMSRSAFAARFTEIVGQPPIGYLRAWRMRLARQKLFETREPVAQIAFELGYDSEAAFNRAFRRECGAPPAEWRRRAAQATRSPGAARVDDPSAPDGTALRPVAA